MGNKRHQKHKHGHGMDARSAQSALDRGRTALAKDDLTTALRELTAAWKALKSDAARGALVEAACRAALADFKVPKHLYFVDAIPKTPTGKIQRRFVAEQFTTK